MADDLILTLPLIRHHPNRAAKAVPAVEVIDGTAAAGTPDHR
ncbi:hypothetical protein BH20CHL6_BH20CHL6_14090 [soil metagenome]